MRSIGLTGGIASGKSTVSAILTELGAEIIDADKLGHQTYEPGTETFDQVVAAFGADSVAADGTIDRRVLGGKVFGDTAQMKRLTDIVWPGIQKLAEKDLAAQTVRGVQVAVLEAAVMIEAGWQAIVDEVWVVSVPPAVARERLMQRNGWSQEEADQRIASQIGNAERETHAAVVLSTDCSLDAVRGRVEAVWAALQTRLEATQA